MIDLYSIRRWIGAGNHYIVFKLVRSVKTGELNWRPIMSDMILENLKWAYSNAYDHTDLPPVEWKFIPYEGLSPLETEIKAEIE